MQIERLGNLLRPVRQSYIVVPREDDPRSPGLHQSTIAQRLMVAVGTYEQKDFDWDRMMMGQLMEAQIEGMLSGVFIDNAQLPSSPHWSRVTRPGEMSVVSKVGNIYVTPDGFDVEKDALHEFKATWYSAARSFNDPEFLNYRIQLKIGCLALDTLTAFLHVFYVCGDWRPPRPWPIQSFKFTFTEQELRENREMLENFVLARLHLFPESDLAREGSIDFNG